jgi:twitching motility protein PilT
MDGGLRAGDGDLCRWAGRAVERGASDLHLTVGLPPVLRVDGALEPAGDVPPLAPEDTEAAARAALPPAAYERFRADGETDAAWQAGETARFRVHAFRRDGHAALALRRIPARPPSVEELGLPPAVVEFSRLRGGLVLATGPAGCGKTTTLAALIDRINRDEARHIVTLEDPVEYVHPHRRSMVNQRQVGRDTRSFDRGLRAALREDPDVILVGEMRDRETVGIALTAAETGHLVLATLHTGDAAQAVDRVIDAFPSEQQPQARAQLAGCLAGVVAQRLLPRADGNGRVAALEVLVATAAVRNLIREGKTFQIPSAIQTGHQAGMRSMESALRQLVSQGLVRAADARSLLPRSADAATGL